MPITKSAEKALRQTKRRTVRNLRKKEAYKNILKRVEKLVQAQKTDEARKLAPTAYKALDKAAKTGVIKKNAAARKKSRMMKRINSVAAK